MTQHSQSIAISVIMPCYNASQTISDSIRSVEQQSFGFWELIIVDDGSCDDTMNIISSHLKDSRIKLLTQAHLGAAKARNYALQSAQGDYIAFLDADDYWDPDFMLKLHEKIQIAHADIIYCGWQRTGLPENLCPRYIPPDYSQGGLTEALMRENVWPIHAALSKRQVIQNAEGFDSSLPCCMDFDLWLRLSTHIKIALVPEVLAYYRFHSVNQITSQKAKLVITHLHVQLEFLNKNPDFSKLHSQQKINDWTWDRVRRKAYENFWKRDLTASSTLFCYLFKSGKWGIKDIFHILFSFAPLIVQKRLLGVNRAI